MSVYVRFCAWVCSLTTSCACAPMRAACYVLGVQVVLPAGSTDPVRLIITGFADGAAEGGPHAATLSFSVASEDPMYDAVPGALQCVLPAALALPRGFVCPAPVLPTVSVTVVEALPPAPIEVRSARVTNAADAIVVSLDGAVQLFANADGVALKEQTFPCDAVLALESAASVVAPCAGRPATAHPILERAQCTLRTLRTTSPTAATNTGAVSSQIVIAVRGGVPPETVGQRVRLFPNNVLLQAGFPFVGHATVLVPEQSAVPKVTVTAVAEVDSGAGVEVLGAVDVVGCALAWTLTEYKLIATGESATIPEALAAAVAAATSPLLRLPAAVVPAGSRLSLTLTATAPFGGVGTGSATVSKLEACIPAVKPAASGVEVPEGAPTPAVVETEVRLGCLPTGTAVVLSYSTTAEAAVLFPASRLAPEGSEVPANRVAVTGGADFPRLFSSAGLKAGVVPVEVCGTACVAPGSCQRGCARFVVTVTRPEVAVLLNGVQSGNLLVVAADGAIDLTFAVRSVDASQPTLASASYLCNGEPCVAGRPANVVTGEVYPLEVTVTFVGDDRQGVWKGRAMVAAGPSVAFTLASAVEGVFAVGRPAVVAVAIGGSFDSAVWSCNADIGECPEAFAAALLPGTEKQSLFEVASPQRLVVAAGAALPGSSMVFTLTVTRLVGGSAFTTVASVELSFAPVPVCTLSATPVADAVNTFDIAVKDCSGGTSFGYQFGRAELGADKGANGLPVGASLFSAEPRPAPLLPALELFANSLVFVVVTSDLGGSAVFTVEVVVDYVDPGTLDLGNKEDKLDSAVNTGDPTQALLAADQWSQATGLVGDSFATRRRLGAAAAPARALVVTDFEEVVAARSAIIAALPAVSALLADSPTATLTRLQQTLAAVVFPDQITLASANAARDHAASVVLRAMELGETLLPEAPATVLDIMSALQLSQSEAYNNQPDFNEGPLGFAMARAMAATMVPGQLRAVFANADYAVAVGNVSTTEVLSTGFSLSPLALVGQVDPAGVTLPADVGVAAGASRAGGVGSSVVALAVLMPGPVVMVTLLDAAGVELQLSNLPPLSSVVVNMPHGGSGMDTCTIGSNGDGVMCVAVADAEVLTCYCPAIGSALFSEGGVPGVSVQNVVPVNEGEGMAANVFLAGTPTAPVTVTLSTPASYCASTTMPTQYNVELPCVTSADCGMDSVCLQSSLGFVVGEASLTFASPDYEVAFELGSFNDLFLEPDTVAPLRFTLSSADPRFDSDGACFATSPDGACTVHVSMPPIVVDWEIVSTMTTPSLNWDRVSGGDSLSETDGQATYAVSVPFQPIAPVVISVATSNSLAVASVSTVVLTEANEVLTFTVTPVNDDVAHMYNEAYVTVIVVPEEATWGPSEPLEWEEAIVDDDSAGLAVSQSVFAVDAGSWSVTYTVVLLSEPETEVTVQTVYNEAVMVLTPASFAFTRANWAVPVTVTVTGLPYSPVGTAYFTLSHVLTSADPLYDSLGEPEGVVVDSVTVVLSEVTAVGLAMRTVGSQLYLVEGGVGTYTLALVSRPSAAVNVALATQLAGLPASALTLSPSAVTFSTTNWNVPVTVTVTATQDDVASPPTVFTVLHTITSTDARYAALEASERTLSVTVVDVDVAGLVPSATTLALAEGGSATLTLVLSSQPLGVVSVAVTLPPASGLTLSASRLYFSPANYTSPAVVTLTLADDDVYQAPRVVPLTLTPASTADATYNTLTAQQVTVSVSDNDMLGVAVSTGTLAVTEGASATYTLALLSNPVSSVVVSPSCGGCGVTFSPAAVTFTAANWAAPVTVTAVRANVDDVARVSPDGAAFIAHTVFSVGAFNGVIVPRVALVLVEDDVAGLTFVSATGATSGLAVLPGVPLTITAALTSMPLGAVQLTLAALPAGVVALSRSTVTVEAVAWRSPVVFVVSLAPGVTVTNVPVVVGLTLTAASAADPTYAGRRAQLDVAVRNPCTGDLCQTLELVYSAYSVCPVACGAGVATRTALCVNTVTGAVAPLSQCPTPQALQAPCSAAVNCAGAYRWSVSALWGNCTAAGVSTRTAQCEAVATGANVDAAMCAGQPQPTALLSRPCNPAPATRPAAFTVGPWGACTKACGGVRTRTVTCATAPGVPCAGAAPPTSETCNDCTFCETTLCSGHGTCSLTAQACECDDGFSGLTCHAAAGCAGVSNEDGVCCGAGSVLDKDDECCAPAAGAAAVALDRNGACCPSGVVNKCGVCDGPADAVMALGVCCPSGVVAASGACCASGVLDAFGVCDGNDASGVQTAVLAFSGVPSDWSESVLNDASSAVRRQADAAVVGLLTAALGRDDQYVDVQAYDVLARRMRALTVSAAASAPARAGPGATRRRLVGSAEVEVDLLPYGGSNNLPASTLEELLQGAPSAGGSTLTFTSVSSLTLAATCGNGVCEAGERPDAGNAVQGCPADCPHPVVACPVANGAECNAAGYCAASGACVCDSAAGYLGVACDECAPGFVTSATGTCVHVESSAALAAGRAGKPASAGKSSNVIVVAAVVAGGGLVVSLVALALVMRWRAAKQRRTAALHLAKVSSAAEDLAAAKVSVSVQSPLHKPLGAGAAPVDPLPAAQRTVSPGRILIRGSSARATTIAAPGMASGTPANDASAMGPVNPLYTVTRGSGTRSPHAVPPGPPS
jgi:hypothetical protein